MKNLTLLVIFIILISSCQTISSKKENWIRLFNGKDLNDWVIKIKGSPLGMNYKNTFRVENGILRVSYDQYDKFNGEYGHIYYKTPFS